MPAWSACGTVGIDLLPFDEMRDPATGRTRVRMVDASGESYQVARHYMTRLEKADLQQPDVLDKLAAAAAMRPRRISPAGSRMSCEPCCHSRKGTFPDPFLASPGSK